MRADEIFQRIDEEAESGFGSLREPKPAVRTRGIVSAYRVRKYLCRPVGSTVYGLVASGTSTYGPFTSGADCRMPHFHSTVMVRRIFRPGSVQQSLTRTSSRFTKLSAGSSIVEKT